MSVQIKAGNFAKTTAAATAAQAVTGVGFKPVALILFTAGKTAANSQSDSFLSAIGYAGDDGGALTYYTQAYGGQGAVSPVNCSRYAANMMLGIVQWGESLLAACTLTSFDADGFTLSWTTNDAVAYLIGYMAIGGSDIEQAAAFTLNTPGATGLATITTPNFPPDIVLLNVIASASALPITEAGGDMSMGAAARAGGQWCVTSRAIDGAVVSRTAKGSFNGRVLSGINANLVAGFYQGARFGNFGATGFQLEWSPVTANVRNIGLAIKGGRWATGTGMKVASTAAQPLYLPFTPKGLIMTGCWDVPRDGTVALTSAHQFNIGVTDGTNGACMVTHCEYGGGSSKDRAIFRDNVFLVSYDALATTPAAPTNVCDIPTMANPVALNWSTSNGNDYENFWIAVGDGSASGGGLSGPVSQGAIAR